LARWAERCVGGIRYQGLRPWLGEWLARWAGRWPVRSGKPRTTPTLGRPASTPVRPNGVCKATSKRCAGAQGPDGRSHGQTPNRPKGPAIPPARPIGPGKTDREMYRPNGPTIPLDARVVRGTVGPLGRTVCWRDTPPGPTTLAEGMAGPLGRTMARSGPENTDHANLRTCDPNAWPPDPNTRWAQRPVGMGIR